MQGKRLVLPVDNPLDSQYSHHDEKISSEDLEQRCNMGSEEKMNKVRLGRTGLAVSEVGFGGIPIINLTLNDGVSLVRHCFDVGITFFDTANMYLDSEQKIGTALASVRERVVLATKTMKRDAEGAEQHIERSLEQLKTTRIDIYQLHQIASDAVLDQVLAPGGAYEALSRARSEGKIGFIGFSSHNNDTASKACRTGRFDTVQVPFNFIETDPAKELLRVAEEMEMGIIGMKPLGGGMLGRADLCFRFLQRYPSVVPIPGMRASEEADEIVALYRTRQPLTSADREEIEKTRVDLGTKFCRRCEYCMPCDQGIQIPMVLGFRGFAKRLPAASTIALVDSPMKGVEGCIECGECIEKCPYELPIPDLLKENLALFQEYVKKHT